jgi:hypothetical protein
MSTTRFCALLDMPERTWRRWQAHARAGRPAKGPWPRPTRHEVRDAALGHALAHPAWGHRKIWAMVRHDGHQVSESTILRLLRDKRPDPARRVPARTSPPRRAPQGRVRDGADGPEPGVATGLLRVRDHRRWHMAPRGMPGLLLQVRAPVPRVTDREPTRRHRRGRARARRLRGTLRAPARRQVRRRRQHR